MIEYLKESVLLSEMDEGFRRDIIRKMNEVVSAVNEGVVWDNKVAADRAVDEVYNTLPISVVAEIIEEEVAAAEAELGL